MINKNKLFLFGINQKRVDSILKFRFKDPGVFLNRLLTIDSKPDVFSLCLIKINGEKKFICNLSELTGFKENDIKIAFDRFVKGFGSTEMLLTGAEAIALLIKKADIKYVFAYPGTSELALCDGVLRTPGLRIINGRGDKESAFMAAGGSLLKPNKSVAILHGARGLTNATGAIADAYRNEIGTVFFVGLPSTSSAPFLPPHGEKDLLKGVSVFVKKTYEIKNKIVITDSLKERNKKVLDFLRIISEGIIKTQKLPIGPVIIGIPQDIIEQRWITMKNICNTQFNCQGVKKNSKKEIENALKIIKGKKHPLIMIDDYYFKDSEARTSLLKFASSLQAPILQIRYLRGPMLFERLSSKQNPYFAGSYMVDSKLHKKLMFEADVLILLEDRNAYSRILGDLPNCPKITITSNPKMTRKNNYLSKGDLLIFGKVSQVITSIADKNRHKPQNFALLDRINKVRKEVQKVDLGLDKRYNFMRKEIGEVLANVFKKAQNPLLVDDSQMFGGLIFESYDKFQSNLRVFGDHGAFIGGGVSLAAGLAICNQKKFTVFCTLGDQSFTNAIQGLISVVQEKIKIIYIVCNNGRSVSLSKQIIYQDKHAFNEGEDTFLCNVDGFEYAKVAKQMGLNTYKLCFDLKNSLKGDIKNEFKDILMSALSFDGPSLIELVLPSDMVAWKGIWATCGKELKSKFKIC